jgi:hypothetical protein
MKFKHRNKLLAAGLLLGLNTFSVQASLTAGTAGGQSVVYSSISNLTWTGDANLLGTLETSNPNLINTIISTIGSITDIPNFYDTPANSGIHTLSTADFGTNGFVNWFGAQAYTKYLNIINYAGSNQWALPNAGVNPQVGYNQTTSSLGQLYYNELNALAVSGTTGSNYGILGNGAVNTSGIAGPFANVQTNEYWLGTELASNPIFGWGFATANGVQNNLLKFTQFYTWAVSPGTIAGFTPSAAPAVVPVPGAAWLFGSGLVGLLGFKRRDIIG